MAESRTIAIVGASPREWRPSNGVMRYLLRENFRVIPVRPDCQQVLGVPVAKSLGAIEGPIDLVDVFRRAEHAPGIAREAVAAGAKALWLQLGVVSPQARQIALEAGLDYVEDACTAVVHAALANARRAGG